MRSDDNSSLNQQIDFKYQDCCTPHKPPHRFTNLLLGFSDNSSHGHFFTYQSFLNFRTLQTIQIPVTFRVKSYGSSRAWQGVKEVRMQPACYAWEELGPLGSFLMG